MYIVRHDPACARPMCGGYWLTIANGVRTRCSDGQRRPRCYVGRAVDMQRRPLGDITDGALVRGAIDDWKATRSASSTSWSSSGLPGGGTEVSGGYYRVFDTGIRCMRAPCFSYQARRPSTGRRR